MQYVKYSLFLFMGVLGLLLKGYRFLFVVVSLETLMMGMIMFLSSMLNEVLFFMLLGFSLISSVLGLLLIVLLMTSYGSEYVKF